MLFHRKLICCYYYYKFALDRSTSIIFIIGSCLSFCFMVSSFSLLSTSSSVLFISTPTTVTTNQRNNRFFESQSQQQHSTVRYNHFLLHRTNVLLLTKLKSSNRSSNRPSGRKGVNNQQYQQQNNNNNNNNNRKRCIEKTVVIAYNKPANVLTTHSEDEAALIVVDKDGYTIQRKTVYNEIRTLHGWVNNKTRSTTTTTHLSNSTVDAKYDVKVSLDPSDKNNRNCFESITGIKSKLHAIGRLDCDTTGLLLITNDGGLVHRVTNPKAVSRADHYRDFGRSSMGNETITKTYEAIIMGHYDNNCSSFELMRRFGVDIGVKYGGMTRPVIELLVLDYPTSKSTRVRITINEGKNRQVRRMFHSIGSGVIKLKRTNIGNLLSLKDIEEVGQWRILSDEEVYYCLGWTSTEQKRSYQQPLNIGKITTSERKKH
jgi:pseudouridine synthase